MKVTVDAETLREVYWAGWLNASTRANRHDQLDDRDSEAYKKMEGEAVQPALASLSAPKGDLTVEELVDMLGGIVYWSGLDEASIGMHGDTKVTSDLEAAVTMLNARLSAPKRHERPKGNSPIEELLAEYEADGCDHSDLEWVCAAARRYVETMEDSQIRCLLHVLATHKSGNNMESVPSHVQVPECRYPDCGCRATMGDAAATEVCPKPESAEAVAWRSQGKSGWMFTDMPHARDIATGIWEPLYTAPPRPEASEPIRLRVIFPDGLVQFVPADTRPGYFEGLGCTVLPIHSEGHLAAEMKANERRYAAPQQASAPVVDKERIGQAISGHLCSLAEGGMLTLDPFDSDNIDAIVDAVAPALAPKHPSAPVGVESARELLAREYEADGFHKAAAYMRDPNRVGLTYAEAASIRAIEHALGQQPAAVDGAMVRRALCAWFGVPSGDGLDRGSPTVEEWFKRMEAALTAALASLSAPKPESAEAVATLLEGDPYDDSGASGPWLSMEDRDRLASLPPGTKLYTAPPRPEASAPVGDSLLQTALRNLPQYISKSGLVGPDKHSAMQCFEVLRDALAQQPEATRVRCGDERYELDAYLWRRESTQEWVLELSGAINDTSFTNRFPVPLSYAPEDAVSLPNYVEQPAAVDEAWHAGFVAGAKWWEWEKTGATMWQADQQRAYEAAVAKRAGQQQENSDD